MSHTTPPAQGLNLSKIFPIILLLLFFSQLLFRNFGVITDLNYWTEKRQQLISDIRNHDLRFDPTHHATHPGTFPLIVSLPLSVAGFSPEYSIKTADILLDTILSISIICAAYVARKNNLWWLAITFFFIFNDYSLYANPSDITTAKLITLSLILLLINFQQKEKTHWIITLLIGIAIGLSASSRIHVTLVLLPFIIMALIFINPKRIPLFLFSFIASTFISNPYLLISPIRFLDSSILGSSNLLSENTGYQLSVNFFRELSIFDLIIEAPLSFLSYLLMIANLFIAKKYRILPRLYVIISILFFSLATIPLLFSSLNTLRYFYPVLIPLQAMLPILVFQLSDLLANLKTVKATKISFKTLIYTELSVTILAILISLLLSNEKMQRIFLDVAIVVLTVLFLHILQIFNTSYFSKQQPKEITSPSINT